MIMTYISYTKKRCFLILILFLIIFSAIPSTTHSVGGGDSKGAVVGGAVGGLGCILAGLIPIGGFLNVPVSDGGNQVKECALDASAIAIKETLIRTITNDIVKWANSGFQGQPAFLANPDRFIKNIGDHVQSQVVDTLGLGGLCSEDIDFDIRAILNLRAGKLQELPDIGCTFSGIAKNFDRVINKFNNKFQNFTVTDVIEINQIPDPSIELIASLTLIEEEKKKAEVGVGGVISKGTLPVYDGNCTAMKNFFEDAKTSLARRSNFEKVVGGGYTQNDRTTWSKTAWWRECDLEATADEVIHASQSAIQIELDKVGLADEFTEIIAAVIHGIARKLLFSFGSRGGGSYSTFSKPDNKSSGTGKTDGSSKIIEEQKEVEDSEDVAGGTSEPLYDDPSGVRGYYSLSVGEELVDILNDPTGVNLLVEAAGAITPGSGTITSNPIINMYSTQIDLLSGFNFAPIDCVFDVDGFKNNRLFVSCTPKTKKIEQGGVWLHNTKTLPDYLIKDTALIFPNLAQLPKKQKVDTKDLEMFVENDINHLTSVKKKLEKNDQLKRSTITFAKKKIRVADSRFQGVFKKTLPVYIPHTAKGAPKNESRIFRFTGEKVCVVVDVASSTFPLEFKEKNSTGKITTIWKRSNCTLKDIDVANTSFVPSGRSLGEVIQAFSTYILGFDARPAVFTYENCDDGDCTMSTKKKYYESVEKNIRKIYGKDYVGTIDQKYNDEYIIKTEIIVNIYTKTLPSS